VLARTVFLLLLPFLRGSEPARPVEGWAKLLREHLERYPLAQAEDVYKLAHQSVFGPAHLIPDLAQAQRYLDEEIASLGPGAADEPLFDLLDDDPPLARVNLRPFRARGGDLTKLLAAFVATAGQVHGDPAMMRRRLDCAVRTLLEVGREPMALALQARAAELAAQGFPAVHHSEAYRQAYRPAYRVVLVGLLGVAAASGSAGGMERRAEVTR
jgi:hypothetical protein